MPKKNKSTREKFDDDGYFRDHFVIECNDGHIAKYYPKGGNPAKDIRCPFICDGDKRCAKRCSVVAEPKEAITPESTDKPKIPIKTPPRESDNKSKYDFLYHSNQISNKDTVTALRQLHIWATKKLKLEPLYLVNYIKYVNTKGKYILCILVSAKYLQVHFIANKKDISGANIQVVERGTWFGKKFTHKMRNISLSELGNLKSLIKA